MVVNLYLPSELTLEVEKLLEMEPHWVAPLLWRSEFRNILALYLRKGLIDFETACNMQSEAEILMGENEFNMESVSVLTIAAQSGCSAYDSEFVSLAKSLQTKLVTADKKLLTVFPDIAISAHDYLTTHGD